MMQKWAGPQKSLWGALPAQPNQDVCWTMTNFLHLIGAQFRETILIQQKVNHACTSALPAKELVFGRAYYCRCSNQKTKVPWVMSNAGIHLSFQYHSILVGFNPLEKTWVKLDHFSKFRSRKIEKKSLINHHTGNVTPTFWGWMFGTCQVSCFAGPSPHVPWYWRSRHLHLVTSTITAQEMKLGRLKKTRPFP